MKMPLRRHVGIVGIVALLACAGKGLGCGGASAEGEAGATNAVVCLEASDCPQPPSPRCGYAVCHQGACLLVIEPGPTAWQKRGDCRQVVCNSLGYAEEKEDSTDVYNDGRPCTFDTCEAGYPKNEPFPDEITCPEVSDGVCYKGDCVACIDGKVNCKGAGIVCSGIWCEPINCENYCVVGCAPCVSGQGPCTVPETCMSGVCKDELCAYPTCEDGVKNGDEVGIDCGPSCGKLCPVGSTCKLPSDCDSEICWAGVCEAPTCTDGVRNGDEPGVDCGGICPMPCPSPP